MGYYRLRHMLDAARWTFLSFLLHAHTTFRSQELARHFAQLAIEARVRVDDYDLVLRNGVSERAAGAGRR